MTTIGVLVTVFMWSTLATSVDLLHGTPTLFVNGIALTIGGVIGLPWLRHWRMPLTLLLAGSGLMFAYHVIYFYALQLGDPIGVSLVHYLWPIIIVCMTGWLAPGEHKPRFLYASALLGFGGAVAACWSMQEPSSTHDAAASVGSHVFKEIAAYLLALLSALAWAAYSVLGKRFKSISSLSVGAFSLPAGLACLAMHFLTSDWPSLPAQDWLVLVYMGLGPMGTAFYLWDSAMKKGNTGLTTALSYATPVLSTIFLGLHVAQPLPPTLWLGVAMVTASVVMARAWRRPDPIATDGRAHPSTSEG